MALRRKGNDDRDPAPVQPEDEITPAPVTLKPQDTAPADSARPRSRGRSGELSTRRRMRGTLRRGDASADPTPAPGDGPTPGPAAGAPESSPDRGGGAAAPTAGAAVDVDIGDGAVLDEVPKSGFLVAFGGQIETARFPFHDTLYCKFSIVYGPEWDVIAGLQEGCTQVAKRSDDGRHSFVWNFPIDVTFKSASPFGWPKIVLQVYGLDLLGRDVVRGYGSRNLPLVAGSSTFEIPMFVPKTSSFIQDVFGWVLGKRPEFVDPKFIAQGSGRDVTRVQSQGSVKVQLTTVTKDFGRFGYTAGAPPR